MKCTPAGCQQSPIMPSTHTSLLFHLVFATKNREPIILSEWKDRFHEYLGGAVHGLGGVPLGVGGVADHVHLLVSLKPTHCLSDFMRELKKSSTSWVRESFKQPQFQWQEGYAAFSVSASSRDSVRGYIANQEAHHRQNTFREELIAFLQKSGTDYDDRYLD